MNDDNDVADVSADDLLESTRPGGAASTPLAAPGSPQDPAMPADDITGNTSEFDEPKTDTGVDPTEAYHEGEDQAAGDPQ